MNRSLLCLIAAVGLIVFGCSKPEPEPRAQPTPTTQAGAAAKPAPQKPTQAQVPVPADFEDQAEKEITEKNYEAKLEALAKDIEGANL